MEGVNQTEKEPMPEAPAEEDGEETTYEGKMKSVVGAPKSRWCETRQYFATTVGRFTEIDRGVIFHRLK